MFEYILQKLFGPKKEKFKLEPVVGEERKLKEYWANCGKDETLIVSSEKALEIAQSFVTEKNISVPALYSGGELVNYSGAKLYTCQEKKFFSKYVSFRQRWELAGRYGEQFDKVPVILSYSFPGEYDVRVTFIDADHTAWMTSLYVSSQTGKVRDCYNLSAERVQQHLARSKQWYVLAFVDDEEKAAVRASELFEQNGVKKVVRGTRAHFDQIEGMAGFEYLRAGSPRPSVAGKLEVLVKEGYKDNLWE